MSFVKAACNCVGTLLILTTLTQPASAQTSLGFDNPDDTANILDYRLPDWGYRTWDLGFGLNGSGAENYRGDLNSNAYNRFMTGLNSSFNLYRESEPRIHQLYADVDGLYEKSHSSSSGGDWSGHRLNGRLNLGGSGTRFLGGGPWSVNGFARTSQVYSEVIENQDDDSEDEVRQFDRRNQYNVRLGAGLGRVRDVTPLIRAQRLSERLAALGRDRLAPAQVQEIARVLATEQGYRTVYDRPDRSFWRDVLEPMLDSEAPLSPYEVFYLRDVLEEDIGPRGEGAEVRAGVFYAENRTDNGEDERRNINRGPYLDLRWVKNLSFNRQLTLRAGADYGHLGAGDSRGDHANADVGADYLWTIADRYRWDTAFDLRGIYAEAEAGTLNRISRSLETRLESEFTVFIENDLSLKFRVVGGNDQVFLDSDLGGYGEQYLRRWTWTYGIGFQYYLDRVLY